MQRSELSLRCQYLYDVFKLWFIPTGEIGSFIILKSFPFNNDDILLIYGHNYEIVHLFDRYKNKIKEENIAIISCETNVNKGYLLNGKRIFLAPQRNRKSPLLSGTEYEFKFDITDAELRLYNCKIPSPLEKIACVFMRIQ